MIVIGDIHGCYNTFMALLEKLPKDEEIVLCGDMVDRGPKSKQVVEHVMNEPRISTVLGNHELFVIMARAEPMDSEIWRANGGRETSKSYGSHLPPDAVVDWMETLPLYIQKDGIVVSHSAIGNVWGTDESKSIFEDTILWSRDLKAKPMPDGLMNVFGHTPMGWPMIEDTAYCIDTGCVFTHHDSLGILTAYDTVKDTFVTQENID